MKTSSNYTNKLTTTDLKIQLIKKKRKSAIFFCTLSGNHHQIKLRLRSRRGEFL